MPVEILQMHPGMIAEVWELALPLLEGPIADSEGCYLPEDVAALCAEGWAQLFLAFDPAKPDTPIAAYVGKIEVFPRRRIYYSLFAGGEEGRLADWLHPMLEKVEAQAKQWGCSGLYIQGRRGWVKMVEGKTTGHCLFRSFSEAMSEGVH